ncbi:MAG TPA: sigma-70 family RNA polymerase sigma factor [Gemmataceae bacterium]|jgi:RNA polymerase sigma factor (sigma-70 family)|nr:sigma-70 family RNA polymerase sigma factor [Gemmataceae bacterium]
MATGQLNEVVEHLRRAVNPHDGTGLSDGQLLQNYLSRREEAALAILVRRHGPMVWGVCRRILHHSHDAEDAFQATFLVFVRKAASIASKELVGNWLYGVAYQTAMKARTMAAKRRERERQVIEMPEAEAVSHDLWRDLQPLLDHALSCLPDKYRIPVVLCDLQGKSRKAAAQQIGCPEGTVAGRLARARTMLAKRLARHGVTATGAALAAALAEEAASAKVPLAVASGTIKAATIFAAGPAAAGGALSARPVALAERVLKTMLLTKLKIATAVLAMFAVLGGGVAALSQKVLADMPALPGAPPVLAEKPADPPAKDRKETASTTAEKKEVEPTPMSIRGIVKAVDAANNKLTVAYGAGETTFTAAKDAKIEIDSKPGHLAGVPVGANVSLNQFVDATTARSIQANGRWFFGNPVRAVDAEKSTITIEDSREGQKTFVVAPDAFINADGKNCKLAQIPAGAFVNLGLKADQNTAYLIGAEGPHLGDCGGSMVKSIDTALNTITFDDKAHTSVAGKTFSISKNAIIVIDGKPGNLAQLPPESYVNITLSVDQKEALHLHAQGPPVDCDCGGSMVGAVDPANLTITFDANARASVAGKTFSVAKDALLVVDGRPGTLTEIPPGALVSARFRVDKATVGTIHANGPALSGVAKSLDIANYSVTVDNKTYPVAKDALVVVDGKQCPLAAVPVGANVNVNLRVDLKTVGMIQTQTK